ncbi:MAG: sulfotransferase family protein [Rubrobacteraceae bacterium]
MTMPNLLVIGAAKSGTTALYKYLGQHPDIYMSPYKEPHFFAFEGESLDFRGPRDRAMMRYMTINAPDEYRALFDGATNESAIGEASPMYLYLPGTAERIKRHVPDAKLIVVLRNPADRAYSNFLHMVRDDREPCAEFSAALDDEERRIAENWYASWHYKRMGFYYEQLKHYFEVFGAERVSVHLHEDLNFETVETLQDIFRFLGVDDTFTPDVSVRYNESGVHKSKSLKNIHTYLLKPDAVKSAVKPFIPLRLRRSVIASLVGGIRNKNLVKPLYSDDMRKQLVEDYREDVLKLEGLIGRDLSAWKK